MTGLTAKEASDSFQNLPSDLQTPPLPEKSVLLAADGTVITSFYDENREPTTLKDVPKVMQHAMVAAEDSRFYQHKGVDLQGVVRAFIANQQAGEITQGASTLTQQYVKNVLKYKAKTDRERRAAEAPNHARKLKEMRLALALEKKYNKDDILDRYLNIAFFGNGGYGIGSAAKVYFSKPVKNLTLAESAFLAGMVKSPTQYNPLAGAKSKQKALDRRNYVIQRMLDLKFVKADEAAKAKKEPLKLEPNPVPGNCNTGNVAYGFYCDYFLRWWKTRQEFGKTPSAREDNLKRGGYRIITALDAPMQRTAQASVDKEIARDKPEAIGTVVVEPGTGYVKAMAINRTFGKAKKQTSGQNYPMTTNPLLTGSKTSPGYQAGSTFKMFTMVAAIEQNTPLNVTIDSPYRYVTDYKDWDKSSECYPYYCPHNGNQSMTGVHTMFSGFGESVNTFFIQLEQQVGVKAAVEAAEKLGVVFRAKEAGSKEINQAESFKKSGGLSFTLGTPLVTPLDMANAYATVGARGKHCDPLPVLRVLGRDGKKVPGVGEPTCSQVIPQDVADAANAAARCPVGDAPNGKCTVNGGSITAGWVGNNIDRPIAGKSGTTNNAAAVWFVGYTPNLASAVFVANPDSPKENVDRFHQESKNVFVNVMDPALARLPVVDFVQPTNFRLYGDQISVPHVEGMDVDAARRKLQSYGFKVRVEPRPVPSAVPAGKVAKTSPGGGSSAVRGGYVAIYVSDGSGLVIQIPGIDPPKIPKIPPIRPPGHGGHR
jgi:membrane peptidoglycan carboxypeptidase